MRGTAKRRLRKEKCRVGQRNCVVAKRKNRMDEWEADKKRQETNGTFVRQQCNTTGGGALGAG